MNKYIFLVSLGLSFLGYSQIRSTGNSTSIAAGNSSFLDASSVTAWNQTAGNVGKGLVFPRTDLTQMASLVSSLPAGLTNFPNRMDGMIVYNVGTGAPKINPTATPNVTPGFYYYENKTQNLQNGRWVRIGDGSANAKLALVQETGTTQSPAVATNLSIDSKDVFAVKGTFTNDGGNTVNIKKPEGFKTLHSIKMYRISGNTGAKQLAGSSLYSYEDVTEGSETKLKLVFGSGIISISYPEGEYEYVLEYLK